MRIDTATFDAGARPVTTTPELELELDQIQQSVRDRYAAAALAASSAAATEAAQIAAAPGCCDEGCCSGESTTAGIALYDAATREGLPDAAVLASLGCG